MTKFRLILSGLISVSLVTMFYLIFVHGTTINFSYLGPDAEYPYRWMGGLLAGSILLTFAGLMTLYFTFFEFQEDENGRLRFSSPDSFLLRFVLKDKLAKPISSCSLFWEVVRYAMYLFAGIFMLTYLVSVIGYIKHEGLTFQSFVALGTSVWFLTIIFNEFFGKSELISKLSSNSWLKRIGWAFFAVILITAVISNPMTFVYILLAFLVMAVIVFVSIWLSGKSSKNSLFRSHLLSKKGGHCPVIYPKDNGNSDAKQAVR
ncbi:MAG: hypothetical protein Q8R55_05170 [Candidatus Taylorbacteria bacterium]|nr:hypothetical protein [Candidatus Taylorbacteria bacterium]